MTTRCPNCDQPVRRVDCEDGETRLLELDECGQGRYALWGPDGAKLPYQEVLAGRGHFPHKCPATRRRTMGPKQGVEGQHRLF